jgi:hypothetical protein
MRLLALALVACSSAKPAPKIEHTAAPQPKPTPTRCTSVVATSIVAPQGTSIALAGDASLVFQGSSLDHFEDGTAAIMLQLEIAGSSWLPDSGDTAWHEVAGYCVRIVKLADKSLELELEATALARPVDCRKQCCTTPESRQPAPDGTVECCMCPATD